MSTADQGAGTRHRSFGVNWPLLRSLRLARGWTQQEAADKAGMTDRLIRKAESGRPLEFKSVVLLAQLYGTPETPLRIERLLAKPPCDSLPRRAQRRRAESGGGLTGPGSDGRDAADAREALVRRWFDEVWNQGRLETIEELIGPHCVLRAEGATIRGPAAVRRRTEALRAAFSDFDLRIEQTTVQADWVIARWRVAMTHTGDWMGAPPTRKRVLAYGSTWIRVVDGVFVEGWEYWERRQTTAAPRGLEKSGAPRGAMRQSRKR